MDRFNIVIVCFMQGFPVKVWLQVTRRRADVKRLKVSKPKVKGERIGTECLGLFVHTSQQEWGRELVGRGAVIT